MNADTFMSKNPITISQDKLVKDAAALMIEEDVSILPVTDEEQNLVGVITESDFIGRSVDIPHAMASMKQLFNENFLNADIEEISAKAKDKPLKDVMSTGLKTVGQDSSMNDVLNLMIEKDLTHVPVVEGTKLLGMITRKDLVKAFAVQ